MKRNHTSKKKTILHKRRSCKRKYSRKLRDKGGRPQLLLSSPKKLKSIKRMNRRVGGQEFQMKEKRDDTKYSYHQLSEENAERYNKLLDILNSRGDLSDLHITHFIQSKLMMVKKSVMKSSNDYTFEIPDIERLSSFTRLTPDEVNKNREHIIKHLHSIQAKLKEHNYEYDEFKDAVYKKKEQPPTTEQPPIFYFVPDIISDNKEFTFSHESSYSKLLHRVHVTRARKYNKILAIIGTSNVKIKSYVSEHGWQPLSYLAKSPMLISQGNYNFIVPDINDSLFYRKLLPEEVKNNLSAIIDSLKTIQCELNEQNIYCLFKEGVYESFFTEPDSIKKYYFAPDITGGDEYDKLLQVVPTLRRTPKELRVIKKLVQWINSLEQMFTNGQRNYIPLRWLYTKYEAQTDMNQDYSDTCNIIGGQINEYLIDNFENYLEEITCDLDEYETVERGRIDITDAPGSEIVTKSKIMLKSASARLNVIAMTDPLYLCTVILKSIKGVADSWMKRQCEPPRDEIQRIVNEAFQNTEYRPVCAQPNQKYDTEENLWNSYYSNLLIKESKYQKNHEQLIQDAKQAVNSLLT